MLWTASQNNQVDSLGRQAQLAKGCKLNPHCAKLPDQSSGARCAIHHNTSMSSNSRATNFYNVWRHCKPSTASVPHLHVFPKQLDALQLGPQVGRQLFDS